MDSQKNPKKRFESNFCLSPIIFFSSKCILWKGNHALNTIGFFTFTCQLKSPMWKYPMFAGSDRENFLLPNFSKLDVECDRNEKVSQNTWNLVFLLRTDGFFWKKLKCIRNRRKWQICCKMRIKQVYFIEMSLLYLN